MKPLSRRSVTTGAIAAVTALPVVGLPFGGAASAPNTKGLVRMFARKLLNERSGITAGEWIERKRCAVVLQALIGDEPEPWTEDELDLIEDMRRRRELWS